MNRKLRRKKKKEEVKDEPMIELQTQINLTVNIEKLKIFKYFEVLLTDKTLSANIQLNDLLPIDSINSSDNLLDTILLIKYITNNSDVIYDSYERLPNHIINLFTSNSIVILALDLQNFKFKINVDYGSKFNDFCSVCGVSKSISMPDINNMIVDRFFDNAQSEPFEKVRSLTCYYNKNLVKITDMIDESKYVNTKQIPNIHQFNINKHIDEEFLLGDYPLLDVDAFNTFSDLYRKITHYYIYTNDPDVNDTRLLKFKPIVIKQPSSNFTTYVSNVDVVYFNYAVMFGMFREESISNIYSKLSRKITLRAIIKYINNNKFKHAEKMILNTLNVFRNISKQEAGRIVALTYSHLSLTTFCRVVINLGITLSDKVKYFITPPILKTVIKIDKQNEKTNKLTNIQKDFIVSVFDISDVEDERFKTEIAHTLLICKTSFISDIAKNFDAKMFNGANFEMYNLSSLHFNLETVYSHFKNDRESDFLHNVLLVATDKLKETILTSFIDYSDLDIDSVADTIYRFSMLISITYSDIISITDKYLIDKVALNSILDDDMLLEILKLRYAVGDFLDFYNLFDFNRIVDRMTTYTVLTPIDNYSHPRNLSYDCAEIDKNILFSSGNNIFEDTTLDYRTLMNEHNRYFNIGEFEFEGQNNHQDITLRFSNSRRQFSYDRFMELRRKTVNFNIIAIIYRHYDSKIIDDFNKRIGFRSLSMLDLQCLHSDVIDYKHPYEFIYDFFEHANDVDIDFINNSPLLPLDMVFISPFKNKYPPIIYGLKHMGIKMFRKILIRYSPYLTSKYLIRFLRKILRIKYKKMDILFAYIVELDIITKSDIVKEMKNFLRIIRKHQRKSITVKMSKYLLQFE